MASSSFETTKPVIPWSFRYGSGLESNNRRAIGHRLDHHQAERFGPVDRKQQSSGASKKSLLGAIVDFPDEPDLLSIDLGLNALFEVGHFAPRHFCGNLKRHAH